MATFQELVESRRRWIEEVLQPWCREATRKDLLQAEMEWLDLAGRPAPETTLWYWAWSRFPALLADGLTSLNETLPVEVRCHDGRIAIGYPDARLSERGQLYLIDEKRHTQGPFSMDEIARIRRAQ